MYLKRTQKLPKNLHFLSPDTHTRVRIKGQEILVFGNFAYALNE